MVEADLIDGQKVQRESMNGKAGGFGRVFCSPRRDELEPIPTADSKVPLPTGQTKARLLLPCGQLDQNLYEHS